MYIVSSLAMSHPAFSDFYTAVCTHLLLIHVKKDVRSSGNIIKWGLTSQWPFPDGIC